MAINRVVVPEWLDALPPDDPRARRSRRDLRWLNAVMGNVRWIIRMADQNPPPARVVEIGAGEGVLCRRMAGRFPAAHITGLDLMPRPAGLPSAVTWHQGDCFSNPDVLHGDLLVGIMILHHFSGDQLATLGARLRAFRRICFCEPWRALWPLGLGRAAFPVVGPVTRHDMMVSIRAGFRPGELPRWLGLTGWQVRESPDWRGAYRLHAWQP